MSRTYLAHHELESFIIIVIIMIISMKVVRATGSLAEECAAESLNLEKAAVGPEKTRRAADLLVNAVKGLQLQLEQTTNKLQQQEARL